MDLIQLEHFVAVADERTFTRAAERVFRTQPAVSQSIKKLESDLGVSLFLRENGHVSLTEAGRLFESYASRMLKLRDDAARSVAEIQNPHSGSLSILAHEPDMLHILPDALIQFQKLFPNVRVSIARAPVVKMAKLIHEHSADIGFLPSASSMEELEIHELLTDWMVLIAPAGHRLAGSLQTDIRELDGSRLILHHPHTKVEELVLGLIKRNGIRCQIAAELWSFEAVKTFVLQHAGLAIVPRLSALHELQTGALVELHLPQLKAQSNIFMIHQRESISPYASCFAEIMRSRRFSSTVPRVQAVSEADCALPFAVHVS